MGLNFIKKRKDDFNDDYGDFYDDTYYNDVPENTGSFNEEEPAAPAVEDTIVKPSSGVSFAGGTAPVALKLVNPKGYEDGPEIADYIANGRTVLLNIEGLDKASTRRLIDFLLGAIHILGGSTKKVTRTTLVFAPGNVGVSGFDEEEEEGSEE